MSALALAAAALAFARAPAGSRADSPLEEAKTAHVHARGEVGAERLQAYADLAEAAWGQWKEYFQTEPPKNRMPLELYVAKDRDSFLAATRAAGSPQDLPGAGGWYGPGSRTSYLYPQPHDSSTRLLVLHELTHQFQYKALQDDVPDRSPLWHREGLAEHFGYHRRTKDVVVTGALDMVAIDDRPQRCADRVRAGEFDAWAIGTGQKAGDYTDAMTLVETFLRTKDDTLRKAYRQWEREIYKGGNAGHRFEKAFDGKRERLDRAVTEVWEGFYRPWSVVYIAWDEKDGAIVGHGMPWAVAKGGVPLPADKRFVEAEVGLSKEAAGGVGIGAKDGENLLGAEVSPTGRVVLFAKHKGTRVEVGAYDLPAGPPLGPVRLRLEAKGMQLTVQVAGVLAIQADAGAVGLAYGDVEGVAALFGGPGEVRFTKVTTGAAP